MSNRKKATQFFIDYITKLDAKSKNIEMYKEYFNGISDKEFDNLMKQIENDETILPYYVTNLGEQVMEISKILKVADELGIDFFQRIWLTDALTGVRYLTPHKYMVLDLPVKRQKQHLIKGKSTVENSKFSDPLTGQATGPSRSSRLSLPEVMILESSGHKSAIEEFMKVRGGDNIAYREARRLTIEQGGYNLETIDALNSRPTSTETLKAYFFGMHIDNNL
jgi:hypothetical protein